jgi:hypothetical protein
MIFLDMVSALIGFFWSLINLPIKLSEEITITMWMIILFAVVLALICNWIFEKKESAK